MERKISIFEEFNGKKIVIISDIRFQGKRKINWAEVELYLKEYIGDCYEITETSEKIYIGNDFPDEYTGSMDTAKLKGTLAKAKANAVQGIPEIIQIAANKSSSPNYESKHQYNAKFGWYRYDSRFALPVYNEAGEVERYNVFAVRMLVRHAEDGKKYLYDLLRIKKETSTPLEP
ncbi:MAG: hypothetical protein IKU09_06665 [Firmicutes bacterium]|nr:hypothetical protein [Bacillota bacterium]